MADFSAPWAPNRSRRCDLIARLRKDDAEVQIRKCGQLPEVKRGIGAYGDEVVMKETLAEALSALFKDSALDLGHPGLPTPASPGSSAPVRAREAPKPL
jgi:uncharacterized membrane protein (UPF0182 family)